MPPHKGGRSLTESQAFNQYITYPHVLHDQSVSDTAACSISTSHDTPQGSIKDDGNGNQPHVTRVHLLKAQYE